MMAHSTGPHPSLFVGTEDQAQVSTLTPWALFPLHHLLSRYVCFQPEVVCLYRVLHAVKDQVSMTS
ncbi:Uncharacterised protein [Chlamydia trachomatis]|nr:Uncharacterised protein [Chlamydia trachomatis]